MLSTTLKEYKARFQDNLANHLKEYEENTEEVFLEKEFEHYAEYSDALNKIVIFLRDHRIEAPKSFEIPRNISADLHNASLSAYTKIVSTRYIKDESEFVDGEYLLPRGIPTLIYVNEKELENHITSANLILEYITNLLNSRSVADTLYKTGKVPLMQTNASVDRVGNNLEEQTDMNDVLRSTIEDYLEEFKDSIKQDGYSRLVDALYQYFKIGAFPVLQSKIEFVRCNKKKIGWALNEIYRSEKTEKLSYEYLLFAKENINKFMTDNLYEGEHMKNCNLYKYFSTKTT